MQSRRLFVLFTALLAACCAFSGARVWAGSSFAITATNVTMPSTGNGVSNFTITNIPMTGTLSMNCTYTESNEKIKIPICPMTPPSVYMVKAGGTLTGEIVFYPYGAPIPASLHRTPRRLPAAGLALSGALLLGFGLRRRARRGLLMAVFAGCVLAGLAGISACGGSGNGSSMTPGTYPYTITANNESSSVTPLGQGASTTITLTVQ